MLPEFPSLLIAAASTIDIDRLNLDPWWPFVYAFIKNMYILLDIILVIAIVMVMGRFRRIGREIFDAVEQAIASGKISKGKVQRKWTEAREMVEAQDLESNKRGAIMAAGILDDCLRNANLSGDNLEGRMAKVRDTEINFRDDIIWAYRMNVRFESEPEFETDKEEVERVFYIFERALKELMIL